MRSRPWGADSLSRAAERIGAELCRTAIWDEARRHCNWVGRADAEHPVTGGISSTMIALYAPLSGGSAGVALFLGELAARTADSQTRETAAAALRRSVYHLRAGHAPDSPLSLFMGTLGVALTGCRLAELGIVDEDEVNVHWLVDLARSALAGPHALDLMGGNAGAIPALLRLAERPALQARCTALAAACADELCQAAEWEGDTCGWNASRATGHAMDAPPLTGFSHGASGMALPLLELHARTGDPALLRTARGAFTYEDRWFSPQAGNWVDLRLPHRRQGDEPVGTMQGAWCHGAPGIGLARARAAQLDPERAEEHARMARLALDTTVDIVRARRDTPGADATLCHGLGGLSEILLIGGELLDEPRYADEARETARVLADRHSAAGDWPCGTTTGEPNPAFLIGTPGIGHHFLRVAAPAEVEPVLLLNTGAPAAAWEGAGRASAPVAAYA